MTPYKSYADLESELATARQKLEAVEREAALYHANSDAYQGLTAEGQLGRRAIEWMADESNVLFYDYDRHYGYDNKKCILCNEYVSERQGLDKPITHKPDCLHLAAKQCHPVATG